MASDDHLTRLLAQYDAGHYPPAFDNLDIPDIPALPIHDSTIFFPAWPFPEMDLSVQPLADQESIGDVNLCGIDNERMGQEPATPGEASRYNQVDAFGSSYRDVSSSFDPTFTPEHSRPPFLDSIPQQPGVAQSIKPFHGPLPSFTYPQVVHDDLENGDARMVRPANAVIMPASLEAGTSTVGPRNMSSHHLTSPSTRFNPRDVYPLSSGMAAPSAQQQVVRPSPASVHTSGTVPVHGTPGISSTPPYTGNILGEDARRCSSPEPLPWACRATERPARATSQSTPLTSPRPVPRQRHSHWPRTRTNAPRPTGAASVPMPAPPPPPAGDLDFEVPQVKYSNGCRRGSDFADCYVSYGDIGWNLGKLLSNGYTDQPDFNIQAFENTLPQKMTFRYSFIGYVLDHWRQVNVLRQSKDCRDTPGKEQPTKGRLATLAAQEMKRYIERCEKEGKPFPYQLGQLWIRRIDMPSVGSLQPRIYFLPHA
ncbi:hypothetical protein C8Q76DRAFT_795798 [Earliella scabrosa]|nr:hypothetical protein C8Q76DRAFT_795798 [Earliella scabrosa]